MTAHRWLTKRHSSLLSRACSTEGPCGSPSSRDRRRQHLLGRPRRRGAAPRRILRWLDRRRAHPWLSTRSVSGKAARAARTQPSARHHPPAGISRRVGALVRLIPGGGREVSENLGWKCRRHGLVAPSAAGQRHAAHGNCATNFRPLSLVFTPDFALSRLTRYRERRAAPSLLHFRQVHPARTTIFGRQEAQDGAWDRPGVDSPRRCGVSARPWRVQGCA